MRQVRRSAWWCWPAWRRGSARAEACSGSSAGVIASLLGWCLWSTLTYWIGTRILPEPTTRSSPGELLRTIGFAQAPGILRVLGVIPGLQVILALATAIWMLVAAVVAIRQALDYQSTGARACSW